MLLWKKKLSQWFFNITKFTPSLLEDLNNLKVGQIKFQLMQKLDRKVLWMQGEFEIIVKNEKIKVFTTRPNAIFRASFLALSCDHPLSKIFSKDKDFLNFKKECDKTGAAEEALAI